MIKVNLLPVKRKKKAKPLPAFLIASVLVTVVIGILAAYSAFYYSSLLSEKKTQFAANERKIAELKEQIKAVDDFEARNKMFKERSDVIEQLGKNKALPARVLGEIGSLVPKGIWLQNLAVAGSTNLSIAGYGFTNSEIVAFVDNLKASPLFTDVYLQESKSGEKEKISVYLFKLTCKIKV
jgi:type IV pilus assembly protein PilN